MPVGLVRGGEHSASEESRCVLYGAVNKKATVRDVLRTFSESQ